MHFVKYISANIQLKIHLYNITMIYGGTIENTIENIG